MPPMARIEPQHHMQGCLESMLLWRQGGKDLLWPPPPWKKKSRVSLRMLKSGTDKHTDRRTRVPSPSPSLLSNVDISRRLELKVDSASTNRGQSFHFKSSTFEDALRYQLKNGPSYYLDT